MRENLSSIELSPASTLWTFPVVPLHNSPPSGSFSKRDLSLIGRFLKHVIITTTNKDVQWNSTLCWWSCMSQWMAPPAGYYLVLPQLSVSTLIAEEPRLWWTCSRHIYYTIMPNIQLLSTVLSVFDLCHQILISRWDPFYQQRHDFAVWIKNTRIN